MTQHEIWALIILVIGTYKLMGTVTNCLFREAPHFDVLIDGLKALEEKLNS